MIEPTKRPHVICHMASSIDGRIVVDGWPEPGAVRRAYERVHGNYAPDGWMCGRVTMEPFAKAVRSEEEVAQQNTSGAARDDFIAPGDFESFAFAIDASGKLAWQSNDIDGDHVVAILSERVSDAYLASLRSAGVSYVLAGRETVDVARALDKIGTHFHVKTLMLEGGGAINGSLLAAGLIDEVSLLVAPVADGRRGMASLFDADEATSPRGLTLEHVERLEDGVVWLRYLVRA